MKSHSKCKHCICVGIKIFKPINHINQKIQFTGTSTMVQKCLVFVKTVLCKSLRFVGTFFSSKDFHFFLLESMPYQTKL